MIRPTHALIHLTVLLLILQTAYASWGLCIGTTAAGSAGRAVIGFHLWDDVGNDAGHYRTVFLARKTVMTNNGYTVTANFLNMGDPQLSSASLSHQEYGNYGDVGLRVYCNCITGPIVYYACHDDRTFFCDQRNREAQIAYCKTQLDMGSDSGVCSCQ
ncbi:hypothetical protein BGZ68_007148 [Mortierella alpina]|nr:hypothetical protein BGZ68_007148 [Mortierella alpina]